MPEYGRSVFRPAGRRRRPSAAVSSGAEASPPRTTHPPWPAYCSSRRSIKPASPDSRQRVRVRFTVDTLHPSIRAISRWLLPSAVCRTIMYRVRSAASLVLAASRINRCRCETDSTIEVLFIVAFLLSPALTGLERHFYSMAQQGARLFSKRHRWVNHSQFSSNHRWLAESQ